MLFLVLPLLTSVSLGQSWDLRADVVVRNIRWDKMGSYVGEFGVYSFYSVEAKVTNLEKTGEVHIVLQALSLGNKEVGRGELFGYIKFGYSKTLMNQIRLWGTSIVRDWKVVDAYVVEK